MKLAYKTASSSPDDSTQNGAVLFKRNVPIATCANLPIVSDDFSQQRPEKYWDFEHAERGVIYKAGRDTLGSEMYCPFAACADCARAIILSGVACVYTHKPLMALMPDRWRPSVERGMWMFKKRNVKHISLDLDIKLSIPVRFDGGLWDGGIFSRSAV